MAIVHGFVHTENGSPALGANVRAFDVDMRSEQPLGEAVIRETSGRYEISYAADQFRRAEKKSADLVVRAFVDGTLRAESDIIFNAQDEERVDLTLGLLPEPPRRVLSELEELQDAIEPVREGVEYRDFTDRDVEFLSHEAAQRSGDTPPARRERRMVQQRLQFLRQADQFADQTDILLAAFYGWFRIVDNRLRELDELLDLPTARLRGALERAVTENIIPDITEHIPEITERISALRFDRGRLITHRFVAQLIGVFDDGTEQPLAGHLIDVADMEADTEERNLGTTTANGQGIVILSFVLPGDAPEEATRRLEITIRDENRTLAVTEVDAVPDQSEVAVIRIRIQPDEREQVPIGDVSSAGLSARLRGRGIETLGDLLANPDITDEEEPEELERVRARAKWIALASELDGEDHAHLIESGILSPLDMAAVPRAEFVRTHHESLGGDAGTYALYKANLDTVRLFQHQVNGAWFKQETSPDDEDDDPEIPTGVKETLNGFKICGCRDCGSAVSPAAYLAHLLDWVLTHVKDGETPIPFAELENDLHQPFGQLPASCSAVEDKVRQVRLVVEALWRFTGLRDQTDLQMPFSFRNAYRHLRNQLYLNILTNLGVSFDQLRKATLDIEGDGPAADFVAVQRRTVADLLGIDEAHVDDLFFNVDLFPDFPVSPAEDLLERLFGFKSTRAEDVFASPERPDLITWQRERLEAIWREQDWSPDDYSGEQRLPFVDPAVIDASYLRTPLDENPAFSLLEARQEELAAHRQTLIDANPQENGLGNLLEGELGLAIEELRALFESLQASEEPEQIEQAHETMAALHLTPAGFTHLMEIDAHLEDEEPVGATEEDIESAWAAVFDILSRSHRHRLFPAWVEAEQETGLILGPKQFWSALEPATPPNPWQATAAERVAWEDALRRRSSRPVIDPDQITKNYVIAIVVFLPSAPTSPPFGLTQLLHLPPLTAYQLWEERREWIDNRLDLLRQSRQGQPTTLDALQAMFEASTLGINLDLFAELTELEAEGVELKPRLAQLGLTLPAYRFLADVHLLAEGNASVSTDKWHAVEGILVQAEKRREFAEWRAAEQEADITLHPHRFVIPDPATEVDDSPQTRWLHDALALRQWVATLEARKAQFQALDAGLARAVSDAEAEVLPLLRNILIMESIAPGNSLSEKAAWLDGRLLMDMFMDGCQMTTRVSQAIETLQRLVRGVYTQEHIQQLQHLTLDAVEDYETEWPVIGSYATWRAYMLAYLYPENLLHLSPPRFQSFGFARLKRKAFNRISPADACAAAAEYADYFRDVCHLEVQASCQVKTLVIRENDCEGVVSALRSRVHLFALATVSGTVYTASFDGYLEAEDTLDSWRPVPKLANVLEIIGAVPHETPKQRRLILLFAKVRQESSTRLMVVPFDLDASSWGKPFELDLPPGTGFDFSVVAVQKRHGSPGESLAVSSLGGSSSLNIMPTILAIRAPNGRVYVRSLNASATDWAGDGWIPLFGPIIAEDYAQVCALIQRSRHEYLMIVRGHDDLLRYRLFSTESVISKDDGTWRSIVKGDFAGAFVWPGTPDVFVFYESGGKTKYAMIEQTADLVHGGLTHQSITTLDGWLKSVVGVSLENFTLNFSTGFTLHEEGSGNEFGEELLQGIFSDDYSGNLLHLLTLTVQTWGYTVPQQASESKASLLEQVQQKGLDTFLQALKTLSTVDFHDKELGVWKLADWYVRQFAGGKGLASAVEDAFNSNPTTFRFRGFITESRLIDTATSDSWHFIPSGGDEEFGPTPGKAIALRTPDGAFRLKLRRSGDKLSAPKLRRVTPNGDGPFDLAPLSAQDDLQLRRAEIKTFYKGLKDSPSSVIGYLKEAYNFLPIYLGYELQRNGFYEEALRWYRQVYDYLQADGKRKIDHSLRLEQSLELNYDEAEEWLDDTSNAHAIAATRKNTYTRQVLLMIIGCLIDFADRLFSRDNVTDNARARELYTKALRLLSLNVLKPGTSPCADIIGELEVEVASGVLPLSQFQVALAQIHDPDRLREATNSLRAISQDTARDSVERLRDMQERVRSALLEIPAPKSMTAVLEDKRQTYKALEHHYLAHQPSRVLLRKTHQRRRQRQLTSLSAITDTSEEVLLQERPPLAWLREARPAGTEDRSDEGRLDLILLNPDSSRRLAVLDEVRRAEPLQSLTATQSHGFTVSAGISFDFCIPQNPVVTALRRRAENSLTKLRTCRNIAGMVRELDPYGAPIGLGSGMVSADGSIFSGIVEAPPTPYRYAALIARTKELVSIAQQIESGYQTALENAEREALSALQAEQSVEQAAARVTLQDLRLNQANDELGLTQLQKGSAVLREATYAGWIAAGKNEHENNLLAAYRDAGEAQQAANAARTAGQIAGVIATAIEGTKDSFGVNTGFRTVQALAVAAEGIATGFAINAQTRAEISSFEASFERRNDEWQLQQGLAALDVQIGDQQIQLARDGIAIVQQERVIAGLEHTHAADVLEFLLSKTFTEEMYRWIAGVLEDVYRFFLQEATSIAHLAERQLAFERQQAPLKVIQSDYWNVPADGSGATLTGDNADRLGLTGSARLLKDIYQLDQYAFETRQRKQSLAVTLDLAQLFPAEFQRFRETGVLIFETPQSLIDRQMPGYYLCLIQRVSVSVVALIPPTYGIRASLTSAGTSRVVVGGDTFQTVTIRNLPERIALTAPTTTTGVIELEPDAQSLLRPFEGTGFDTLWELRMPKAANPFDYNTIATVLFTVELTALHSFDYERQVIEAIDRRISANRAFYFRQEFADQWYDLHNPDQTATPMTVRFETRREDFPPNLENLRIDHVLLYFVGAGNESGEIVVQHFSFTEHQSQGAVGGGTTSVDGVISTRRGNGTSWLPMIGKSPIGVWELALPDTPEMRNRFQNNDVEDILLVITFAGHTPEWPK